MLGSNHAGIGVGGAPKTHATLQHRLLHLLGEVHVEQAGVKATAVELVDHVESVLLCHHVDKTVTVDYDHVDDTADAGEQAPDIGSVDSVRDVVDVDRVKFERRHFYFGKIGPGVKICRLFHKCCRTDRNISSDLLGPTRLLQIVERTKLFHFGASLHPQLFLASRPENIQIKSLLLNIEHCVRILLPGVRLGHSVPSVALC